MPKLPSSFYAARERIWAKKRARVRLHTSFRRSYREDYQRKLEVPGLIHHAASTFKLIFTNWRLFLPFLALMLILNIAVIGLLSEETYQQFQSTIDETTESLAGGQLGQAAKAGLLLISTITTGGLGENLSESQQVFAGIFFLIIWLVTIYLVRHRLAGHRIKLRDGLYNALTPLISTFVVLLVLIIQAIPLMVVIITYSAAISTDFLSTPFYALLYFIFAALMLLLSGYLISSSFLALVAVSAPGLYPLAALHTASDLIAGRRIRLLIRLVYLVFVLALCWVIVMLPVILLDMWLKSALDWLTGVPIIPFFLLTMTIFSAIYASAYCYLFYRRMLDYVE